MGDALQLEKLDTTFCDEVEATPGGEHIRSCFACGTCAAGCPVTAVAEEYNCRIIIQQIRLGLRAEVLGSPALWLCQMCYRCYARCPQQVNFTDIMRALRYLAVKHGFASAATAAQSNELETVFQDLRKSIIREMTAGKSTLLKSIQALVKPGQKNRDKHHA